MRAGKIFNSKDVPQTQIPQAYISAPHREGIIRMNSDS
jgi:hypothetical protein